MPSIDENKLRLALLRILAPQLVTEIIEAARDDAPVEAPRFAPTEEQMARAHAHLDLREARHAVAKAAGKPIQKVQRAQFRGDVAVVRASCLDGLGSKERARIERQASSAIGRPVKLG